MVEIKHAELNNSSHTFSFGLEIHFCHCPGTGVAGPPIRVLVKDHVDLQTVVVKEWGTEDVHQRYLLHKILDCHAIDNNNLWIC